MTPTRFAGLTALFLTFVADQASKLYVLFGLALQPGQSVDLGRLITLVYTWNRGISFSLFQQDDALGRWILTGFMLTASVLLGVWLFRTSDRLVALGLGFIIGGALGNAVDRIANGAVFDFIRLDLVFFVWPAIFNIADAAIVVGVAFLLYDSLMTGRGHAVKTP